MDMIAAINTGKVQFEFEIYTTNQQWNPNRLKGDVLYLQLEHIYTGAFIKYWWSTFRLKVDSLNSEQQPHRNQKRTSFICPSRLIKRKASELNLQSIINQTNFAHWQKLIYLM